MQAYVITSGAIFGMVVVAHLARIAAEGAGLARDPWYVLLTIAAAALCAWAVAILRHLRRT